MAKDTATELRALVEEIGRRGAELSRRPAVDPIVDPGTIGPLLQRVQQAIDLASRGGSRSSERLVRRLLRPVASRRNAVDEAQLQALLGLNHVVATMAAVLHRLQVEQAATVQREAVRQADIGMAVDSALAESERLQHLATETSARLHAITRRLSVPLQGDLDQLYQEFEDRFRGSEAEITRRLEPYIDDVFPSVDRGGEIVDIGAGRGEWLQLLAKQGWPSYGVELGEAEAASLRSRGLRVEVGDGVEHLERLPEGTLAAVTAFHVIEHLGPADAHRLVTAAHRALRPGGLLIVETPNVGNLRVGASTFYRDPSHVRPVPADWLEFLVERAGFTSVEVRYLQPVSTTEPVTLPGADERLQALLADLQWALDGPQDVAVLGRRAES